MITITTNLNLHEVTLGSEFLELLFFDIIVDNSNANGDNDSNDNTASFFIKMCPAIFNDTEDCQYKNGDAQDYKYDVLEDITDN